MLIFPCCTDETNHKIISNGRSLHRGYAFLIYFIAFCNVIDKCTTDFNKCQIIHKDWYNLGNFSLMLHNLLFLNLLYRENIAKLLGGTCFFTGICLN